MICEECAFAADQNRIDFNAIPWTNTYWVHPDDCGCPCQHELPRQWEKTFSTEQPNA